MTMKKITVIIVIVEVLRFSIAVLLIIAAIINIPKIMDTYFMNKVYVPEPEITYMEFPIRIEYIVNGETRVIEDTYICEYKGYERRSWLEWLNVSDDFYTRFWDCRLEIAECPLLLYSDNKLRVEYFIGSAGYFMGDEGYSSSSTRVSVYEYGNYKKLTSLYQLTDYGIEIIDCTLPEPIVNSFK